MGTRVAIPNPASNRRVPIVLIWERPSCNLKTSEIFRAFSFMFHFYSPVRLCQTINWSSKFFKTCDSTFGAYCWGCGFRSDKHELYLLQLTSPWFIALDVWISRILILIFLHLKHLQCWPWAALSRWLLEALNMEHCAKSQGVKQPRLHKSKRDLCRLWRLWMIMEVWLIRRPVPTAREEITSSEQQGKKEKQAGSIQTEAEAGDIPGNSNPPVCEALQSDLKS